MIPDDVIASVRHHMGEEFESSVKPLLAGIESITADGNSVVFVLSDGNADFPFIMNDYHIPILPSKDGVVDWQSGVGAGGYTLMSHEPGIEMELERFANDLKGDTVARFAECELLGIADVAAWPNAIITGEVHAMNRVDLKTAHLLARDPNVLIEEVTGTQHYTIPMNTTVAPFDNVDVRLALKYALDREDLLQKILRGHGLVGNDHPIAPANRFYAGDLEQRAYDPDKARFHLKQAGLDSLTVELSAANTAFEGAVDTAVLYQENAARAELDTDTRRGMYHEMQAIVRDDGGAVVPMYANYIDARSPRVAHPDKLAFNWELDGWKLLDRWWMA